MILVAPRASVFDCYVQRVLIQTGLLKAIKYSTFEVSAQNEIVDELIRRMNISDIELGYFRKIPFG